MKTKRFTIVLILAVLGFAYLSSIIPNLRDHSEWKKTVRALQDLPKDSVDTAVAAFARDRKATNSFVPTIVSLRELVSGGYLRAEDIRGLEAKEVTVSLTAGETTPSEVWIRVRTAHGDIVLMADGSIQRLSSRRENEQDQHQ